MTRRKLAWRGVCVICHVDLYRDPQAHYLSDTHQERAAAWERARERERDRGEPMKRPQ